MPVKSLYAKWAGKCHYCANPFAAGTLVKWDSGTKAVYHPACYEQMIAVATKTAHDLSKAAKPEAVMGAAGASPGGGFAPVPEGAPSEVSHAYAGTFTGFKPAGSGAPKTQKARGIRALQQHGILAESFARIAQTADDAESLAVLQGFPCFARPCPITPRHGFVDSRVVKDQAEVRGVFLEAREADPEAELIIMPFVEAEHNMVWRPGLLSVGPGHDGATAGVNSISVFIQPQFSTGSQHWQQIATDAGVNLEAGDPYIEAVSSAGYDTVVTQVRGGPKMVPTDMDWNPEPGFVVESVITLMESDKKIPGKMLEWETIAKQVSHGTVVYTPGDNQGSHWAVHAQQQWHNPPVGRNMALPVFTSRKPEVGEVLGKCGVDPVPLDPQSLMWGFLGGLAMPRLRTDLGTRKRCCCAAMMGAHHGMRMGGDSSQHFGASVAFLLRLSQAALWGEARHAEHMGLSRDQVYKAVLDDWGKGRDRLAEKVSLFHTYHWGHSFGGKAWAAIGHATIDLDKAVLGLIKDPSPATAGVIVEKHNLLINLCHNANWFLDKFIEASMWNLAADLDPRVALLAGPAWYQATLTPSDARVELLSQIEAMAPVKVGFKAPKGKVAAADPGGAVEHVTMGSGDGGKGGKGKGKPGLGKIASGIEAVYGEGIPLSGAINTAAGTPKKAQARVGGGTAHVQVQISNACYVTVDVSGIPADVEAVINAQPTALSMAGTGTPYHVLPVEQTSAGVAIKYLGTCK